MTINNDKKYNLTMDNYSERSIIIRGDTMAFRLDLKLMGGYWNPKAKGGGGYIFSKERYTGLVHKFVELVNQGKFSLMEYDSNSPQEVESNHASFQLSNCDDIKSDESDSDASTDVMGDYEKECCCMTLRSGKVITCSFHATGDYKDIDSYDEKLPVKRSLTHEFDCVWCEDWTVLPKHRAFHNKKLYCVYLPGTIIIGGSQVSKYDEFFRELGGTKLPNGPWMLNKELHDISVRAFLSFLHRSDINLSPVSRKRTRVE